jgi:hypothetical protein
MFHLVPAQRARVRFVDDAGTETLCPPRTGATEFLVNVRSLEEADKTTDKDSDDNDEDPSMKATAATSDASSSSPDNNEKSQRKKRDRAAIAIESDAWPFQHVATELRNASQEALQLLQFADLLHKQQTFQLDNVIRQPASHQTRYDEYAVNIKRKRDFLDETLSVLRNGVARVHRARVREQEHFDTLKRLQRRWGITAPAHGMVLTALRAHEHLAVDCKIPTLRSEFKQADNTACATTSTEARIFQHVSHRPVAGSEDETEEVVESRVTVALDTLSTLQVRVLSADVEGGEIQEESCAFALSQRLRQSASQLIEQTMKSDPENDIGNAGLSNDELLALQLHSNNCHALFLRLCHEVASEGRQANTSVLASMVAGDMGGSTGPTGGGNVTSATSSAAALHRRQSGGGGPSQGVPSCIFPGLDGASPRASNALAQGGATHHVRLASALSSITFRQQQQGMGANATTETANTMMMVRRMSAVQRVRYQVLEERSSRVVVSAGTNRRLEFTLLPVNKVVLEQESGTMARAVLLEMEGSYRAAVFNKSNVSGDAVLLALVRSAVAIALHLGTCEQLARMWSEVADQRNKVVNNIAPPLTFRLRHTAPLHSLLQFDIGSGVPNRKSLANGEICVVAGIAEVSRLHVESSTTTGNASDVGGLDGRATQVARGGGGEVVGLSIGKVLETLGCLHTR